MSEPLFDVLIYEIQSGIVESVVGCSMPRDTGRMNAETRLETVLPRLNDMFDADIFPAGKYKKGDKITTAY